MHPFVAFFARKHCKYRCEKKTQVQFRASKPPKLEFQHMPAKKSHHPARRQTHVLATTTTTTGTTATTLTDDDYYCCIGCPTTTTTNQYCFICLTSAPGNHPLITCLAKIAEAAPELAFREQNLLPSSCGSFECPNLKVHRLCGMLSTCSKTSSAQEGPSPSSYGYTGKEAGNYKCFWVSCTCCMRCRDSQMGT